MHPIRGRIPRLDGVRTPLKNEIRAVALAHVQAGAASDIQMTACIMSDAGMPADRETFWQIDVNQAVAVKARKSAVGRYPQRPVWRLVQCLDGTARRVG